jgi:hypothetical protein
MSRLSAFFLSTSLLFTACSTTSAPTANEPAAKPFVDPWASAKTTADPAATWNEPALDRERVRAELKLRRDHSIQQFIAYRENRVYPINTFAPDIQHVWRDATGRLCAAATLIAADWGRDAAGRVADQDNFLKLADVHDGPLMDWMLTSGLTQHEIVAIQEPMRPPPPKLAPGEQKEVDRLYAIYTSVDRQLRDLYDENLDEATDALMKRPDLARALLRGEMPTAGAFATPAPAEPSAALGSSQPPPA